MEREMALHSLVVQSEVAIGGGEVGEGVDETPVELLGVGYAPVHGFLYDFHLFFPHSLAAVIMAEGREQVGRIVGGIGVEAIDGEGPFLH